MSRHGLGHTIASLVPSASTPVQMTPRLITGVLALGLATIGMVVASLCAIVMIEQINRKRPKGDLVSYFGFTFWKNQRIFNEYRRLYPAGRLHVYAWSASALAIVGLLTCALCVGLIG